MEYVDGDTLRDVLKKEGPLPPKRAMEIVADVCAALDFSTGTASCTATSSRPTSC